MATAARLLHEECGGVGRAGGIGAVACRCGQHHERRHERDGGDGAPARMRRSDADTDIEWRDRGGTVAGRVDGARRVRGVGSVTGVESGADAVTDKGTGTGTATDAAQREAGADAGAVAAAPAKASSRGCPRLAARAAWLENEILPHGTWLRNWIARRFPRENDVDDLVQESFARVLDRADPDTVRDPRAFLGQTAKRLVYDRASRSRIVQIDYHDDLADLGLVCAYPLPDAICIAREECARVLDRYAELPERTRQIVDLRRLQHVSQRDTAAAIGITESAIEKHLKRGMVAMAEGRRGECEAAD